MTTDERILPFREASRDLAEEVGLPVITPQGSFVADASVAWVLEAVEEWAERTQKGRRDRGWFHASSLGRSDAELVAQFRGESETPHNATTLRIFDNGHGRDRAWKRYLAGAGISVVGKERDRRISLPALHLRGSCDDIVQLVGTPSPLVFEFKTINPYAFGQLQEPLPDHVLQVHAYMAGLGLSEAVVVYECKSNQALRAFKVEFSVETWAGICIRLRRLAREAGTVKALRATPSLAGRKKAAALEM